MRKLILCALLCLAGSMKLYATDVVGGTHVTLPTFTSKNGASITAAAVNGWGMKSAKVDNSDSWTAAFISGNSASTSYISTSTGKFAVTLSGELVPPNGNAGNGPVDFSIKANFDGELYIDATSTIIAEGASAATLSAMVNGQPFNAKWTIEKSTSTNTWTGNSIENSSSITVGSGGNWNPPTDVYTITASDPANAHDPVTIAFSVVRIKQLSAKSDSTTVTSTKDSPGDNESICIDVKRAGFAGGSVSIAATSEPGSQWPENQPEWYVGNTKVQTGGASYTFSAGDHSTGVYKVEARCGSSKKAINVYIVRSIFMLIVQSSASGAPIEISFNNVVTEDFVGHVAWRLSIVPAEATNIAPFKIYKNVANVNVGFHSNSNNVALTGIKVAPTPSFHVPDAIAGKVHSYPITLSKMNSLLSYTDGAVKSPGNYVLGTSCFVYKGPVKVIDWTHPASRNCASTARAAGNSVGLGIPSALGGWSGSIAGLTVIYSGEAPSFLAGRL